MRKTLEAGAVILLVLSAGMARADDWSIFLGSSDGRPFDQEVPLAISAKTFSSQRIAMSTSESVRHVPVATEPTRRNVSQSARGDMRGSRIT